MPFCLIHRQPSPTSAHGATRSGGFSLVEMAVVLAIIGLLASLFLPLTNTMMDNNRRKETRTKLEALQSALTRFVITNRRLPCPADGSLATGAAAQGREARTAATGVCAAMTTGVVPWVSLGLAQTDALDAWYNLVTYRVRGDLAASGLSLGLTLDWALDMTACDMVGTGAAVAQSLGATPHQRLGCNALCVSPAPAATSCTPPDAWLSGRGLRVDGDATGANILMDPAAPALSGAAYVLISHGSNRAGAYNANGVLQNVSGAGPGPLELLNANNVALRVPPNYYIDAELNENTASYYDDIVLRPTLMAVILAAGLGPRVHN